MSFLPALVVELLVVAVAVPALTLAVAVMLLGRPAWLGRPARGRRAEPGIHSFLLLGVLAVVDVALVFLVPFVGAWTSQEHRYTALIGLFLAVLVVVGLLYAWRRGVLRWD
jgi:NADH:ubiquinone oxidoreductase subunit 3 (subunit A)